MTSGPAPAKGAGPGVMEVKSEWDSFTPQSGLGFINISVSVALQYFVILTSYAPFMNLSFYTHCAKRRPEDFMCEPCRKRRLCVEVGT